MNYGQYLQTIFPGIKVQKISVNAGFSCPNRDGAIGFGGCIYCRNDSFSPSYCMTESSIEKQIEDGKKFFSRKYPEMKYLVYFQSYTNTYGRNYDQIKELYERAIASQDIVGLVIGTRPDTLDDSILDILGRINLSTPVFLEIGAETASDETLNVINRGHKWEDVVSAVERASLRKLHCGLHLIAGLPGEDESRVLKNVTEACKLPIETLKLHQLQILKDTPLFKMWEKGDIDLKPYSLDEYLDLCCKIVALVPEKIVIERFLAQSPPELVVAPKWGLKNYQFTNLLNNKLKNDKALSGTL